MTRLQRDEVEAIFRRAAELEQAAALEAPAELLSDEEVVSAGLEAGLSEASMRLAISETRAITRTSGRELAVLPAEGGLAEARLERVVACSATEVRARFERFLRDEIGGTTINGDPGHWLIEAHGARVRIDLVEHEGRCQVSLALRGELGPKLTWPRGLKRGAKLAGAMGVVSLIGALGGGLAFLPGVRAASILAAGVLALSIPIVGFFRIAPDTRGVLFDDLRGRLDGFLASLTPAQATPRSLPPGDGDDPR